MPRDSAEEHYESILLPTRVLVIAACFVVAAAVVLSCLVLRHFVPNVLVSAADMFAGVSAYLAGNAYRLGDVRTRKGHAGRMNNRPTSELLATLTPLRVVRFRFQIARYGFVAALIMLVAAFLTIHYELDAVKPLAGVAILGVIASTVTFLCGLWAAPLD